MDLSASPSVQKIWALAKAGVSKWAKILMLDARAAMDAVRRCDTTKNSFSTVIGADWQDENSCSLLL